MMYLILKTLPILIAVKAANLQYIQQMPQLSQIPQMQLQQMARIQPQSPPFPLIYPQQQGPQAIQMTNLPHLPLPVIRAPLDAPVHLPPIHLPMPGGRLPIVMVPHHTHKSKSKKRKSKKRRLKLRDMSSSDEYSDTDSSLEFRTKNDVKNSKKRRREVLTPVVSYVTKDGYIIYQKKIKKENAKDWLEMTNDNSSDNDKTRKSMKKF